MGAFSALPDLGEALGDEVEAFLGGWLVEHLRAVGRAVPAWAVLNKPAHATVEELMDLARPGDGVRADDAGGREPVWRCAQRSLAADLLDAVTTPDEVLGIQRAVLVPLELWLIERSKTERISARRAIQIASEVLADHSFGR